MIKSIKHLFSLLSKHDKRNLIFLIALLVCNALIEIASIGLLPLFVSALAYPESLAKYSGFQNLVPESLTTIDHTKLMIAAGVLLLVFFFAKTLVNVFVAYCKARYTFGRIESIGQKLFNAYMQAPYVFHLSRNTAELLRNINSDCLQLAGKIFTPLLDMLTHALIVTAILLLLAFSVPATVLLWLLLFFVFAFSFVAALHKRIKREGSEAHYHRGRLMKVVNEGLGGIKELKLLNREQSFLKDFGHSIHYLMSIQRFIEVLNKSIPAIMEMISIVGILSFLLVLYLIGTSAESVVTLLTLFFVSLLRIKTSVVAILNQYTVLRHNLVSVDAIYRDIKFVADQQSSANITTVHDSSQPALEQPLKQKLNIERLWYRYPDAQHFALKDIDLIIQKGETIGFVGVTGSGKSTLIDIILGLFVPTEGHILSDNTDIRSNLSVWQRNIGYIPQSTYLIDGSIKQNVALGIDETDIDDEALETALKAASLDEMINALPEGVDTVIGERGVRLSGGQRQRISVARALYHKPGLLVMDEATSALDNITERAIMQAIEQLKGDCTILIIAHRLSTVRQCNRVVLMKNGSIEAIGHYDELFENHALFKELATT